MSNIVDPKMAAAQASAGAQFRKATPEELHRTLVMRLASSWSLGYAVMQAAGKHLDKEEQVRLLRQLQEHAGLLYHLREDLQALLPEETYERLAEAAGFPLLEHAAGVFEETGDLMASAKALSERIKELYLEKLESQG